MPSLGFSKQFVPRVESGEKTHSIRGRRKRPEQWMPGKLVHLFYAMRTKHCRRLGTGVITEVRDITIHDDQVEIDGAAFSDATELSAFARADGFLTWQQFVDFFDDHYALPWSGSLIKWQLIKPLSPTAQEGTSPMNNAELIKAIADETGIAKATIATVITSQASHVSAALTNGEGEATLHGIGKLKMQTRAARTGRNPKTGESIEIAAKSVVKFSVAKTLKDAVA